VPLITPEPYAYQFGLGILRKAVRFCQGVGGGVAEKEPYRRVVAGDFKPVAGYDELVHLFAALRLWINRYN